MTRFQRTSAAVVVLMLWPMARATQHTTPGEPAIPTRDFSGWRAHPVLRVPSGDTVVVNVDGSGRRLGLVGVDVAPMSQPAGAQACRFLENLLAGESVYVEFLDSTGGPDGPARVPAFLYRAPDGLFVNLELVRQGYAKLSEEPAFEYLPLFKHFEQRAREARKGCWAPEASAASATTKAEPATPPDRSKPDTGAEDVIVYVTKGGKRYHRADCYHLRKSRIATKLSEAQARGYTPCSHCKPPG